MSRQRLAEESLGGGSTFYGERVSNFSPDKKEFKDIANRAAQAREDARAKALAKAQAEYARLETRLRKSLVDVQARERKLAGAQETLREQHATKLSELQLLQQRMRLSSRMRCWCTVSYTHLTRAAKALV